MSTLLRTAAMLVASLLCAGSPAAEPLPRTVLVLDQSIPHTAWFGELYQAFQSTLKANSEKPITIYSEKLEYSHFKGSEYDRLMLAFIKEKYRQRPFNIIVAVGLDTLQFAISLRTDLGSALPIVFCDIDGRAATQLALPPNVTGTMVRSTLQDAVVAAKALVPNLKRIALVGDPLEEQTYRKHYKDELPIYAHDLEHIDLMGLPMPELRRRVASLPERTAILYTSLSVDGAGARYDPNDALRLVAEVANRPIVIDQETRLGYGGTGGFLLSAAPVGEATARIVLRLLDGQSTSNIPITIGELVKPVFDWRQLQRWGVGEDRLPAGSEVRFRPPTAWEQYRWQIVLIATALLLQSLAIAGLLHQRRRRHLVEVENRQRTVELARMNRRAIAGQMSASIAHEVNQPLTAILADAEALQDLLGQKNLDLDKIREVVTDIISEDTRASDVVDRIRKFLRRDEVKSRVVDLNDLVHSTLHLLHGDIVKRNINVETALATNLPAIVGDVVQLQQVLINLMVNAMDAVESKPLDRRIVKVATRANGKYIEADTVDSGHGILADNQPRLFEPFFTTKEHGLGLGLSICSTIVKAHGGKLSLRNNDDGGATATLSLLPADAASVRA